MAMCMYQACSLRIWFRNVVYQSNNRYVFLQNKHSVRNFKSALSRDKNSKIVIKDSRHAGPKHNPEVCDDFFGIERGNRLNISKVFAKSVKNDLEVSIESGKDSFEPHVSADEKVLDIPSSNENSQKIIEMNFGFVRFDADNVTRIHGEHENDISLMEFERRKIGRYRNRRSSAETSNESDISGMTIDEYVNISDTNLKVKRRKRKSKYESSGANQNELMSSVHVSSDSDSISNIDNSNKNNLISSNNIKNHNSKLFETQETHLKMTVEPIPVSVTSPIPTEYEQNQLIDNFIDDQYFQNWSGSATSMFDNKLDSSMVNHSPTFETGLLQHPDTNNPKSISTTSSVPTECEENQSNNNFIDEQYLKNCSGSTTCMFDNKLNYSMVNRSPILETDLLQQPGTENIKQKKFDSFVDDQYFGSYPGLCESESVNLQTMVVTEGQSEDLTGKEGFDPFGVPYISNLQKRKQVVELSNHISLAGTGRKDTSNWMNSTFNLNPKGQFPQKISTEGTILSNDNKFPKSKTDIFKSNYERPSETRAKARVPSSKTVLEMNKNSLTDENKNVYERRARDPPQSAYEYVMNKRRTEKLGNSENSISGKETQTLEFTSHKKFQNQIQDFSKLSKEVVLHLLKSNIVYNNYDIVALDKPYGMVSHGDETKVKCRSLSTFLPELAQFVDPGNPQAQLYPIHRLDRDTTGLILYAKNEEMAKRLHLMFLERTIEKTYWAITRGVPSPLNGVIKIPIMQGSIDGRTRMVLRPEMVGDLRPIGKVKGSAREAITEYRTLQVRDNAALLEIKPKTGVKHQIRVHLGFGMSCPVLGDHKYSHLTKLAPQKISDDMLKRLDIRQSKVRHLPMHLHAQMIILPEFLDGSNIVIRADLPNHFVKNMKTLGLTRSK